MESKWLGALLLVAAATPLFSQSLPPWSDPVVKPERNEPIWFQLTETRDQVGTMLGKPAQVVEMGNWFYSWQYQMDSTDEEYSHYAVFRKSDGKLISVTRQYPLERKVDELFPADETVTCFFPDSTKPAFGARVRRLSGGRLLIAMGSATKGKPTGQILLIRETELGNFYPWIQAQLSQKP